VTARVHVGAAHGAVEGVKLLTDTLVAHPSNNDREAVRQAILSVIVDSLLDAAFPAAAAESFITVPFVFQVQVGALTHPDGAWWPYIGARTCVRAWGGRLHLADTRLCTD